MTFISALSLQRRRLSPTNMEDGKMAVGTKRRRVQETYEVAIQINGATKEHHQPALEGVVVVLNPKFSKKEVASSLSKKNILAMAVTCKFQKDQCVSYEKNMKTCSGALRFIMQWELWGNETTSKCVNHFHSRK